MSRYDDDLRRGRGANYTYSGGAGAAPSSPRVASPGRTTYNGMSQARLTYEPQGPLYPHHSPSSLQVPEARSRPRSLPPPVDSHRLSRDGKQERGYNKYGDSDDSDDGMARSPIEKARKFADNTFTDSTTGLGVGLLGALVGGLAAREAVDLTGRQHKGHYDAEHKRNQLISTMVGAAVGALGANAVEKRIENNRAKDDIEQEKWERKWRPNADVLEKQEVIARPQSKSHGHHRRDRDPWEERDRGRGGNGGNSRRGLEREIDPEARSWKNVEDWLWDDRERDSRPRSSGRRSIDTHRY
ncbi:hypothetical protein F5Y19DRAFT_309289 [Xylariaceae sp. FL1651]|nr:hypothetical protein F5Y19DRAFT_309289 [Xylariaceae sp. FL1651]